MPRKVLSPSISSVNLHGRPLMLIRNYSPDDWVRICAIHDAARKLELAASGLQDAFLTLEQTFEGEGLFDGVVLVCQLDREVTGFVAFSDDELTWLYVDPAAARQGVGRALLRRAIAACGGKLSTEVLVGNEPALQLYLSEGFRVQRRVDGKLTGNESFPASGFVLQRFADDS